MKLSKKEEAIINAVAFMQTAETRMTADDIAEHCGTSRRFLEASLQNLCKKQILKGVRGPKGGYEILRTEIVSVSYALDWPATPTERAEDTVAECMSRAMAEQLSRFKIAYGQLYFSSTK